MKTSLLVIVVLVVLGAFALLNRNFPGNSGAGSRVLGSSAVGSGMAYPSVGPTGVSGPTGESDRFEASELSKSAYKIFPGTPDERAKQAMSGFTMKTDLQSDGSTVVTLEAQIPGYTTQSYTLKNGDSLYFIERNTGDDDASQNTDATFQDDTAVVVDAQGNIVR